MMGLCSYGMVFCLPCWLEVVDSILFTAPTLSLTCKLPTTVATVTLCAMCRVHLTAWSASSKKGRMWRMLVTYNLQTCVLSTVITTEYISFNYRSFVTCICFSPLLNIKKWWHQSTESLYVFRPEPMQYYLYINISKKHAIITSCNCWIRVLSPFLLQFRRCLRPCMCGGTTQTDNHTALTQYTFHWATMSA